MFFFLGKNTLSYICITQIECKSFTDDKNINYAGSTQHKFWSKSQSIFVVTKHVKYC